MAAGTGAALTMDAVLARRARRKVWVFIVAGGGGGGVNVAYAFLGGM
jgi:hypothetical protein